ncbi:Uncharacterized protein Adt_11557 [Abeliophyllum distichum]|uniref:Uncharacterized protein n=1 Tax=Abeliophyllum distichum TaxID=126358 RepID=A0ABD1UPW5_9LAMI
MSVLVTAMMNRTCSHPFKISLSKNPPDTMHELLKKHDKYVDAEEVFFITKGMKAGKKKSKADEPPNVLCAYHTNPRGPAGKTPFKLSYGMEVVVPVLVVNPTLRMKVEQTSDDSTRVEIDLLEEVREKVTIKILSYKCKAAKYFDRWVKSRTFQPGDLVLRNCVAAGHPLSMLEPNWQAPSRSSKKSKDIYIVLKIWEGHGM